MLKISGLTSGECLIATDECLIATEREISKSSCKIPNGEAFFEWDNEQTLVVRVDIFFEDFSCKFEKTFSCLEIPEFQASLIKNPTALFKQIMDGKELFPKNFSVFFDPQEKSKNKIEQASSKLTDAKRKISAGKDHKRAFASGSDDGIRLTAPFRSPRKGRSIHEEVSPNEETSQSNFQANSQTRQRAKSHTIRPEDRKVRSSPEIISKPIDIKKTASLKEPLHNKTLGLRISPREKIDKSEKTERTHSLSPKLHRTSPREFLQNLTGKSKHHPPQDVSQGSSLDSSPRLCVELDGSNLEGSKVVVEPGSFKIPNVTNGKGWFSLNKDETLDMKIQVTFEGCKCEFERKYSPLEKARIDFNASQIKNPHALFEKVIEKRHLVSENFNPFFCPQRKIVEVIEDDLSCTEKDFKLEIANSSYSREMIKKPFDKSVEYLSLNNPKTQELGKDTEKSQDLTLDTHRASKETQLKYRDKIQLARDNNDRLSEIYFGNYIGRVPTLPKEIYDDLDLPWEGKTVGETHSLYLVFEKMNGQPTCFGNFEEAIQRPAKGKEKYRMDLSKSKYSEEQFKPLAEIPYWMLITDEAIEGTVNKSPEEQAEIMFRKGGAKYKFPNLVEMGIHEASKYISNRQSNSLNVSARCVETTSINGQQVNMVMKHGSKEGELIVSADSESESNAGLFGVIRYLPEKKQRLSKYSDRF